MKKHGDLTNTIRKLAERPIGVSLREVADTIDRPLNVASGFVTRLVRAGDLHKGGIHGEYRYFKNPDHAQAHNIASAQDLKDRQEAYRKRQNASRAARDREKRAQARVEAGLPPYVKPEKKPKPVKAKRVELKPRDSGIVLSTTDQYQAKKKAHKQATIIWPEHVKVQVIPTGQDLRYKFIPPSPKWRGQITKDWYDRRLAA